MPQHIEDLFEERARSGDGSFAIAWALMQIAGEQKRLAANVQWLGTGDAASPMGAIELLSKTVLDLGERIAGSISELADQD